MGKIKNLEELKKALDFGLNIDIIKKIFLNTEEKLYFTYDDDKIVEVNDWELSESLRVVIIKKVVDTTFFIITTLKLKFF